MRQPTGVKVDLPDAAATEALGAALAAVLPGEVSGWTVLLDGELGSGKTSLARGFLRALGHVGAVPSPTYTLVEPYELPRANIYHIDLYRISDAGELPFLGWDGFADGLTLIEWPERAPSLAGTADLAISLSYAGHARCARMAAVSARGAALLGRLRNAPGPRARPTDRI